MTIKIILLIFLGAETYTKFLAFYFSVLVMFKEGGMCDESGSFCLSLPVIPLCRFWDLPNRVHMLLCKYSRKPRVHIN